MSIRIRTLGPALFAIALTVHAHAQTAPPALLVDVEWLSQHLNDRNLVVLHVDDKAGYDAEHIPGARHISMGDVARPPGTGDNLALELPAAEALRAKLATFGISDDSHVVLYLGRAGGLPNATRIILSLDYIGLGDRTSLLNGGLPAWKRAGKPVTADVPTVVPGTLTARATKPVVVDAEFVKSLPRPNQRLVDGRAASYYSGIEEGMGGKKGHIPGAVNIPFTQIIETDLTIDRGRLEKLFRDAGVKPGESIVAYCHIGMQATAVIFGARLLGHPAVLYDGSFQDWATNNRGPVEVK